MKDFSPSWRGFFLPVLICACAGAAACAALTLISSCFLLFAGDPSKLFLPVGLSILYLCAMGCGAAAAAKTGNGVPAGFAVGAVLLLMVLIGRLAVPPSPSGPRAALLTVLLFTLIPAFAVAGAIFSSRIGGGKKRPSYKRRSKRESVRRSRSRGGLRDSRY